MTGDEQTIMTLLGNAGGRMARTSACFDDLGAAITSAIGAGYVVEVDGFLLMGTVGENALATALAPGG